MGLMQTCLTLHKRSSTCYTPSLRPEWLVTLVCVFCGCICVTTTVVLILTSIWDRTVTPYAKWVGFVAGKIFIERVENNFYILIL